LQKLQITSYYNQFPLSPLSQVDYTQFINNQFAASDVIKKNKLYTKVEVSTIVEKDGTVSKYAVKGTGTEAMKNEIVRILKLLPKNTLGTRDGQAARFRLHLLLSLNMNKGCASTSALGFPHARE